MYLFLAINLHFESVRSQLVYVHCSGIVSNFFFHFSFFFIWIFFKTLFVWFSRKRRTVKKIEKKKSEFFVFCCFVSKSNSRSCAFMNYIVFVRILFFFNMLFASWESEGRRKKNKKNKVNSTFQHASILIMILKFSFVFIICYW